MRLSLRIELAQWIIIAAMFVAASVVWPTAPDQLPVHWSIQGQADGYGGKFERLLLLPLVTLGIYLLLAFLPRFDPGAGNYARFANVYALTRGFAPRGPGPRPGCYPALDQGHRVQHVDRDLIDRRHVVDRARLRHAASPTHLVRRHPDTLDAHQ